MIVGKLHLNKHLGLITKSHEWKNKLMFQMLYILDHGNLVT